MNLTRCPVCATVFRVMPDQLQAHGGKVRCGNCGKVFDARAAMLEANASAPAAPAPSRAMVSRRNDRSSPAAHSAQLTSPEFHFAPDFSDGDLVAPDTRPEPEPVIADAQFDANADEYTSPYFQFEPEELASGPLEANVRTEPNEASEAADAEEEVIADAEQADEPRRRRHALWLWAVAAILMLVALSAQAAYVFRSELALHYPELQPTLAGLCASLGCEVSLPRKVDQVGIETSDLHPDPQRKSSLVLAATLKNRATFAQAFPHLELTLTDARDQAIARRVMEPKEYLSAAINIAAGFAANQELPVHVVFEASGLDPTGYRVYIFYP